MNLLNNVPFLIIRVTSSQFGCCVGKALGHMKKTLDWAKKRGGAEKEKSK